MVCLLQPKCNFLHRFFRCKLPVEVVDMEVKVTSIQGMHIFRRDRTTQLINVHTLDQQTLPTPHHCQKNENFPGSGKQDGTNNPSTG